MPPGRGRPYFDDLLSVARRLHGGRIGCPRPVSELVTEALCPGDDRLSLDTSDREVKDHLRFSTEILPRWRA